VLALTALILGGGLIPQPGVASRYHAATEIIARRQANPPQAAVRRESRGDSRSFEPMIAAIIDAVISSSGAFRIP
jgi:NADH-quinone oxidoreductase subunit M